MSVEKLNAVVFDMDGTLYQFPDGKKFAETDFGRTIKANTLAFIGELFEVDVPGAQMVYDDINTRWNGEISLGIESEMGVSREEFFEATWNLDAEKMIVPELGLAESLGNLSVRLALLTSAPRVWADRALERMGILDVFGANVFTGEPDIRKPNPLAFLRVADAMDIAPKRIVSIGDQEVTDIVPAKAIGMRAVRVGGKEPTVADGVVPSVVGAVEFLKERNFV